MTRNERLAESDARRIAEHGHLSIRTSISIATALRAAGWLCEERGNGWYHTNCPIGVRFILPDGQILVSQGTEILSEGFDF